MIDSLDFETRLIAMARQSSWFFPALIAARNLELTSWCIGAGAVRNLVWDALHGFAAPSALSDIDLAHFDERNLSAEQDRRLEHRLTGTYPNAQWEVTNQAAVHRWFEASFGYAVRPLTSLKDAVGSWPEYATSVGLTLNPDDSITVIAPYGLDDLFKMVIRRNPARVSIEAYEARIKQKQYATRWQQVTIIR
ncbi:nucleotidyltransferase family protein [Ralstonia soli]|uniref:Nucleotidyltransferase family protein n=1 Tax=Ralstonia soli TaxID=2953896 RepID=A0ABT1AED2_9RALS|nr:nucleotidyltransferase family protein [Ralstonia soli]MCO5396749.1 nucleotidyltransferase family protein [Ralstonia soli]